MKPQIRRFLVSKFLLIPVGALLLFSLIGFVIAPLVIRWYVPRYARDHLKCEASLGKVRLNPYLLRFEANDFHLKGPDGALLVEFARLYLDCEMTGFFRWAINFREIRLEKPTVNLVIEPDGSLNFAALAPKAAEREPKPAESKPAESKPLRLILGIVAVADGEVTVTDKRQVNPAALCFHDLDLELKTLTTLVDENGTYRLEAGTPDGETIAWQGQLSLIPFHSRGKIVCSGIRTASVWKFMQNAVNLEQPKGVLGVSTDYELNAAQSPVHLALQNFQVNLSDVALQLTGTQAPFFVMKRFGIDSARFDLASREVQINQFLIDGGALHVGVDEAGLSNFEQVMRSEPGTESRESARAASNGGERPAAGDGPPWTVRVEAFEIKNVACDVEDLSRSLPMAAAISKISVRSRATIEAGARTQVAVKEITTELNGLSFGVKAAPRPLFAAERLTLEEGELDLGAHTFKIGRIGLSQGHVDVGLDQQGKINWERLLTRSSQVVPNEPPAVPALKSTADNRDRAEAPQPAPVEKQATGARQPANSPPASADEAPWKVDIGAVDIKEMAFGLEDLSRSSPVAAGIGGISIGLSANIEAGRTLQVAVQKIATELKGLQLGIKGAPKPLFAAERFTLEGGEVDLAARALSIARINLSDGYFDVARSPDGKIDWEQLFVGEKGGATASGPTPASTQASPWKFLLKSIELDNFRSDVMDRTVLTDKPLYQLRGIKVRVSEVDGKSPIGFDVGFGLEQGGKVVLRGKIDPTSPSVEASVNLAGVNLTPVQAYLEPFITLTLDSAAVSTEGTFRYGQPAGGSKLSYEGSFGVDRLSLKQPGSKETFLGWDALQIPKMKLAIEPNRLQIDEIALSKPVGEVIIKEDRTVNLAEVVKKQPAAAAPAAPPKQKPKSAARKGSARSAAEPAGSGGSFPFSIGRVRINDGDMVFADFSLKPKFKARIHALKGTVSKLSSEQKTMSQVKLDGRVDQYGQVKISGALDINDFKRSTDITMVFRNVEMANISPYSGKFAGRRIKSGKLSLDLQYKIQSSKLVGENKIIVDNLVLGEKVDSPDAVNLPLDLAVALLSDSNGRIDLGLPVSGELDNPQFSIGAIIWKTLVNIIVKAATAPFRALGSLLGSGSEKFDAVAFDPGKAELQPPEKEKLKKVAEALQKRPQLKLAVQGQYSPEIDGLELRQLNVSRAAYALMEDQRKPGEEVEPLDFSDSKVRDALEKLYSERFGPKALDEVKRAVKEGKIKPRADLQEGGGEERAKKKPKGFARVWSSMKLYKVIPGALSPEQSDLLAGELFARLVEKEPSPDEALSQLAQERARSIAAELESADAIPADRLQIADVQPAAEEGGLSAKLSLAAAAAGN